MLKLNLGCGKRLLEGYVNIDSKPFVDTDGSGASVRVMDVRNLQFSDGSVDEILAEFVLEHISFFETQETIWEFWRVLKVDGILSLVVPDFDEIAKAWLAGKINRTILHYQLYCSVLDPERQMPHLCVFDKAYLKELLNQEGFEILSMENIGTDVKVRAKKLDHKDGVCR